MTTDKARDNRDSSVHDDRLDIAVDRLLSNIKATGFPGWAFLTVEQARAAIREMKALAGDPEPVAHIEDICIAGEEDIPVRIYIPDAKRPMPVMVYLHGGGWIIGDYDEIDTPVRALANRSGCAIVSVDYRLAPEHKYPAALEDAYAAVKWASISGSSFGWDGLKLAVAGDSAGGNLAAAVSLLSRDENGPPIQFQLLVYPVLDRNYYTESYRQFGERWGTLTRTDMVWFHCNYLSHPDQLDLPYVSPLRSPNLAGLPQALVIIAEADPLRDEGLLYAQRLKDAGVPVEARVYAGMIHGFWQAGGFLTPGRQAIDDAARVIRSSFLEESEKSAASLR